MQNDHKVFKNNFRLMQKIIKSHPKENKKSSKNTQKRHKETQYCLKGYWLQKTENVHRELLSANEVTQKQLQRNTKQPQTTYTTL